MSHSLTTLHLPLCSFQLPNFSPISCFIPMECSLLFFMSLAPFLRMFCTHRLLNKHWILTKFSFLEWPLLQSLNLKKKTKVNRFLNTTTTTNRCNVLTQKWNYYSIVLYTCYVSAFNLWDGCTSRIKSAKNKSPKVIFINEVPISPPPMWTQIF